MAAMIFGVSRAGVSSRHAANLALVNAEHWHDEPPSYQVGTLPMLCP